MNTNELFQIVTQSALVGTVVSIIWKSVTDKNLERLKQKHILTTNMWQWKLEKYSKLLSELHGIYQKYNIVILIKLNEYINGEYLLHINEEYSEENEMINLNNNKIFDYFNTYNYLEISERVEEWESSFEKVIYQYKLLMPEDIYRYIEKTRNYLKELHTNEDVYILYKDCLKVFNIGFENDKSDSEIEHELLQLKCRLDKVIDKLNQFDKLLQKLGDKLKCDLLRDTI